MTKLLDTFKNLFKREKKVKTPRANRVKKKFSTLKTIVCCILVLYAFMVIISLVWALINSLKTYYDFRGNVLGLPTQGWHFENYITALTHFSIKTFNGTHTATMIEMYVNSILYAGGCALMQAFVSCITAYIVARFNFKPLRLIYVVVIVCMVIPIVGSLPAQVRLAYSIGFINNVIGMWLMSGYFLGMYFLVFYAAFRSLPKDYTEAAKVDGASNFRIMFRIMLPLVKNIFLTIFLLLFIQFWNNYQTPLLFMPDRPVISVGLYYFDNCNIPVINDAGEPMRITGCMLVFIPMFIVYLIFHDRLMGNLNMGGIKE